MRGRICKRFTFDAAHMLPGHDGKCANLHGHTYVVEVEFEGPIIESGPKAGMVVDFGDVKAVWKLHLEPLLDHRYLNETLTGIPVTTAEWIAVWIHRGFDNAGLPASKVRVWETPTSWAQHP
jgi:6-pyruvoyltetrahydropterin/6-carboxytetrahydropterin synthase